MKKYWLIPLFILGIFLLKAILTEDSIAQVTEPKAPPGIPYQFPSQPAFTNENRIGINLGGWETYGAEQFMKNILQNPGFEGQVDRMNVFVTQSDAKSFSDKAGYGNDNEFWNGAIFEVRSGQFAETTGTITKSLESGENGLPQYFTDSTLPALSPGDMITLTKFSSANPVQQWWIPDSSKELSVVDTSEVRPGSNGKQSLALKANQSSQAEALFYLDGITERAGILLPINGHWMFSIWAKGESLNSSLQVSFERLNQTKPFLRETIRPTSEWQLYTFDFTGSDHGQPQPLKFSLVAQQGEQGTVWVDDVWLGPVQENPTAFRDEVVKLLKSMNPSFIREFSPLGDTLLNHIADPSARQSWSFRLTGNGNGSVTYGYSLAEFLDLCQATGANPWIFAPTVFNELEYKQLGQYLAQNAPSSRFSQVIVEFGNENWNVMFRPLAVPDPDVHGVVATKAFQEISEAAKGVNLRLVVNGQAVNPWMSNAFLTGTTNANSVAIAPYYYYKLNAGAPKTEVLSPTGIFASDEGLTAETYTNSKKLGKDLAIYEINLSTTEGNAPQSERDPVVVGGVSGSALAYHTLRNMLAGANPILVYNLAQYDTNTWEIKDMVKLWGVVRDIGVTGRIRPAGLAIKMLNRVIAGDVYQLTPVNEPDEKTKHLTIVGFKTPNNGYTAAAVNTGEAEITVAIQFPDDGLQLPTEGQTLKFDQPYDTNEDAENVTIATLVPEATERTVSFSIPAYGFVTLGNVPPPPLNTTSPPSLSTLPPEDKPAEQSAQETPKANP